MNFFKTLQKQKTKLLSIESEGLGKAKGLARMHGSSQERENRTYIDFTDDLGVKTEAGASSMGRGGKGYRKKYLELESI